MYYLFYPVCLYNYCRFLFSKSRNFVVVHRACTYSNGLNELEHDDIAWLCEHKLIESGINVKALLKEE